MDPSNHIRRKQEKGVSVAGSDSAGLHPLSILPRWENEWCGRRTEGVMVKKSDGDKKRKEVKKKEMALGGLQKKQDLHDKSRGNVNEKVKWQKSKKKNEDEKKRKIKGGALMS